jgi:hypothetical protein
MYVVLLCLYVVLSWVGRDLCDGLITRPEESYCVSNSVGLRNLRRGSQGPILAVEPMDGYKLFVDTSVCHVVQIMKFLILPSGTPRYSLCLGINVLARTLFSNNRNLCSSLRYQVSHSYKITVIVQELYYNTTGCMFLLKVFIYLQVYTISQPRRTSLTKVHNLRSCNRATSQGTALRSIAVFHISVQYETVVILISLRN